MTTVAESPVLLISTHVDADPDPAFLFDADPDPDPTFYLDADSDPTFHFDAAPDPDPAPHECETNLQPLAYTDPLRLCSIMSLKLNCEPTRLQGKPPWLDFWPPNLLNFDLDANPDTDHSNADLDRVA